MNLLNSLVLFLISLLFSGLAVAEMQAPPAKLEALKGGLNVNQVTQCSTAGQQKCRSSSIFKLKECLINYFKQNEKCKQNLAVLDKTSGIVQTVKHYPNVDVVHALMFAADHSSAYLMISKQGEIIQLTNYFDQADDSPLADITAHYPQATVWPIALGQPSYKALKNGETRLIFKQQITNECMSCKKLGVAEVAYDFNKEGGYISAKLLKVTPQ